MPKNNNKARWLGLALTTLGLIAIVITSFVWVQADVKAVDIKSNVIIENVGELKEEGCLPSRVNGDSIIRIEGKLETIQTQQQTAFKEILDRLPEK